MKKGLILITGLITTVLALYYVVLWFILFRANTGTFEDLKLLYLTFYPGFINGTLAATLFNLGLCIISIFLFWFLYSSEKSRIKKLAVMSVMILNAVMLSWLLWTMM